MISAAAKTLNVLLVEDSPAYSALVLRWFSGHPGEAGFVLVWTDSLGSALSRLEKGGIDVIVMDLGLPDSDGLETFRALHSREGNLPIIVLSGADSQGIALQTIQLGAEDYLIKSQCTSEILIRALRHAVARHRFSSHNARAQESASVSRVIGVLGGSGGVGVTTVACVLAAELQRHTTQRTLLIDLDANPGLVAFTMGIDPRFTIQDLAANTNRLDVSLWESMLSHNSDSVDVLAAPKAGGAQELDIEQVNKVVRFAAIHYPWVVLDLGRMSRTARQLLGCASDLVLVSRLSIPALRQCKQAIGELRELGVGTEQLRMILNRTHDNEPFERQEFENVFGVSIAAILPPAHDELDDCFLRRCLPDLNGAFRLELSSLARKMAGLAEPPRERPRLSLKRLTEPFRRKSPAGKNALSALAG